MAEFTPTPSQLEAMTLRGPALLVAAGAGSGKTRVLTERVLRAVCDPDSGAELDSFLVISFTRAAAAELRGRIMEALAARLAADPSNRRLRRQSALLSRAQIGTIHSFCAQLLRENCQAAGLAPDFRILDEDRARAMRSAALDRALEEAYDGIDKDPDFRLLADTAGEGRDDRALAELVLNLHSRMQCQCSATPGPSSGRRSRPHCWTGPSPTRARPPGAASCWIGPKPSRTSTPQSLRR